MDKPEITEDLVTNNHFHDNLVHATNERISRIHSELANGFELISKYDKTVTFFGSARFDVEHPYYKKAREIAGALTIDGYTIVSGGGPGIMQAANHGAKENNGNSVGLNILLPHEQGSNPYVIDGLDFRYFFTRKVMLAFGATAYIYFPGGYGTLDEFFEIITLMQTGKMPRVPVICVGKTFWTALDSFVKKTLRDEANAITPGDENLYSITEDIVTIKNIINSHYDNAPKPLEIIVDALEPEAPLLEPRLAN